MSQIENDIQDLYQKWLSGPTPALCVRLAGKLRHSERNSEALEVARKGLESWADNISVNVIYGKCSLDAKLTDEALKVFEKVISIDPLNLIAIRSLAEIHYSNGNWNRALELFEEYLFEYPGDPDIEIMLKKARDKKKEADREARVTGQDVSFPETGRMASILASQKKASEKGAVEGSQTVSQETSEAEKPVDRAPRSLFNLFTPAECEELGLSAYDK